MHLQHVKPTVCSARLHSRSSIPCRPCNPLLDNPRHTLASSCALKCDKNLNLKFSSVHGCRPVAAASVLPTFTELTSRATEGWAVATRARVNAATLQVAGCLTEQEPLDLRKCRHFVNLTNGIEALPMLHDLQLPYSFVRIQSTACEQQNLEALVSELDANLLLSLALGHCCLVYDCGSRRRGGTPRALWYGLEFVRYTLSKLWLRQPCPALLRGKNVSREFDNHIRSFKQSTRRRVQYYAKYLPAPGADGSLQRLRLYGVFRTTYHDEDTAFYVSMLQDFQRPPPQGQLTPMPLDQDPVLGPQSSDTEDLGDSEKAESSISAGSSANNTRSNVNVIVSGASSDDGVCSGGSSGGNAGLILVDRGASPGGSGRGRGSGGSGHSSYSPGLGAGGQFALARAEPSGGVGQNRFAELPVSCGGIEDGETELARYGFHLFRRGLSPAEWAVRQRDG